MMKKKRYVPPPTVALIDDDSALIEINTIVFKKHGYQVLTASNGKEGLDLVREHMPSAIVLDIEMPVMNGIEVLKHLREEPTLCEIPVVVYTNNCDAHHEILARLDVTCLPKVTVMAQELVCYVAGVLSNAATP